MLSEICPSVHEHLLCLISFELRRVSKITLKSCNLYVGQAEKRPRPFTGAAIRQWEVCQVCCLLPKQSATRRCIVFHHVLGSSPSSWQRADHKGRLGL